ncbi:MAG: hypothetical protein R3D70_08675 [Rhizobiaceae bacterium]
MTAASLPATIAQIATTKKITPDDVLALRRIVYGDGVSSRPEVEALFALDRACPDRCDEWVEFLIETVTDYIVHQEAPRGHISSDNASWLVSLISDNGVVDSLSELEMLIKVLEKAKSSPEELSAYALAQVALAVVEGDGPLAKGRRLQPGLVGADEVALLRRILFAFGGDGNIAVTRAEADILLKINKRTAHADNDEAWNELFIKSIANFALAASGYEPPSRQEALRREAFLESGTPGVGGFFSRMVSGGLAGLLQAYERPADSELSWAEINRRREESFSRIDGSEAQWLVDKFGGGRELQENERAVLAFIREHARSVHPDLKPLLDRVA